MLKAGLEIMHLEKDQNEVDFFRFLCHFAPLCL